MSRFTAVGSPALRRAGAAGKRVGVAVEHGSLVLAGEDGPPLAWPIATIARIRVGFDESKSVRYYRTLVWQIGAPRPIRLDPDPADLAAYGATIRALAHHVAAARGLALIERGIGPVAALVTPVLIGLVFVVAAGISLFVITEDPWWGRMLVPIAPGMLSGFVWRDYWRVKRSKAVADLAELERQLPG